MRDTTGRAGVAPLLEEEPDRHRRDVGSGSRRDGPLLYSLPDSAYLLGVSLRTVKTMVHDGRLPVVRIGRRALVQRAALERVAQGLPPI